MTTRSPGPDQETPVGRARGVEERGVERGVDWVETGWDDPRAQVLRAAMDVEMAARYADVEEVFSRLVEPPGTRWTTTWVAVLGDRPVATATLRRLGEGPGALHEVKKVYVAPEGRRRGLAVAALSCVEASARELGLGRLHLHTGDRQPEAIALYEREGWDHTPVFAPYDAVDVSVCFTKAVPPA